MRDKDAFCEVRRRRESKINVPVFPLIIAGLFCGMCGVEGRSDINFGDGD